MLSRPILSGLILSLLASAGMAVAPVAAQTKLSAMDIANKNASARGGLQAWRQVKTLRWEGKLGVGGDQREPVPVTYQNKHEIKLPTDLRPNNEVQLPFVMEMARPRKIRFELQFHGQTALQIYDGSNGWKLRPYLNRRVVEPYTDAELRMAAADPDLDGPLMDYAAKGAQLELLGTEKVEDRDTYKLKITSKSGREINEWIDAQTFLETKVEGQPRTLDGRKHAVEIYYRDYRSVAGLQIPFILETRVLPLQTANSGVKETSIPAEKITIEKVEVNPPFPPSLFAKPNPMEGAKPN